MKRIRIIVEDTEKKRVCVIPLTHRQAHDFYDIGFMAEPEGSFLDTLKLNKVDKSFWELHKIGAKLIDTLDEGRCCKFENGKFVSVKHKFYHSGKRPKWRKLDGGLK